jgi:IMP dehydrogenase
MRFAKKKEGLSFDDVLLVPRYSDITSRSEVNLTSEVTQGVKLRVPILSANMDTVTEASMAEAMFKAGGMGVLHRFMPNEKLESICKELSEKNVRFAISVGVNDLDYVFVREMVTSYKVDLVVVDVAHGHHYKVLKTVEKLSSGITNIMAGNIVTWAAARELIDAGATALKVGIGPGSHCTTRSQTGHGYPQLTAIEDVATIAAPNEVKVCADGGIRTPGDIVKAFAAGADTVMVGKLFAGCHESPGSNDDKYKMYRGSASYGAKLDAGLEGRNIEGVSSLVPYAGTVAQVMEKLEDGIKSGFSYTGARTFSEFQAMSEFIRVTPNEKLK